MSTQFLIAISAGLGGVAPSLVHLAQGFIKPNPDVPGFFYFIGVGIFFALGALVAFAFAETNTRKAFFLGIGLPALVATAQTQGIPKNVALALVPSANAQSAAPNPPVAPPASVTFKPAVECQGCEVWFVDPDGKVISKRILSSATVPQQIEVPQDAAAFGIADPKANFKLLSFPKEPAASGVAINFDRKYSPFKDFRRGLGDYDLKAYYASVTWGASRETADRWSAAK